MNRFFIGFLLFISISTSSHANLSLLLSNQDEPKKNVVFIIVDDLNKTLGSYGHPVVLTPNIDQLAKKGVQFNGAYCNFPVCNPSRSSLLTGVLPENLGILDNRTPLQSKIGDMVSMPYLFKNNGYYTASLGKVFHGSGEDNDMKAWDEIHSFKTTETGQQGEERNITDGELKWCHWRAAEGDDLDQMDGQVAQKAVEIIKEKEDKPLFLAVGFHKPHDPFIAPKKYFDMYPLVNCNPAAIPFGWQPPYPHTLPSQQDIFARFTDQDKREFLRSYYACTSFMDAQVGKVMKALEEKGMIDNTLIVFFGDHGYHLGEHEWWNKVTVYEKGHNAPMIIIDPSNPDVAGIESNALVEFVDIYPTLAEVCNLENIPAHLEGKSFKSVLDNPLTSFRDGVYSIVRRGGFIGRTVKTRDWRYIEWDQGNQGTELYDQINDPLEYHNLADNNKYHQVEKTMKLLMEQATNR